jgi:hypothetical protein
MSGASGLSDGNIETGVPIPLSGKNTFIAILLSSFSKFYIKPRETTRPYKYHSWLNIIVDWLASTIFKSDHAFF